MLRSRHSIVSLAYPCHTLMIALTKRIRPHCLERKLAQNETTRSNKGGCDRENWKSKLTQWKGKLFVTLWTKLLGLVNSPRIYVLKIPYLWWRPCPPFNALLMILMEGNNIFLCKKFLLVYKGQHWWFCS